MNPFDYQLTLRIRHPSLRADEISARLGLQPQRSWSVGERRSTPTGGLLEGANRSTYWSRRMAEGEGKGSGFEQALVACVDQLDEKRNALASLLVDSGSANFFIGWFGEENFGVSLPAALLRRISDLGIDLQFDVYP